VGSHQRRSRDLIGPADDRMSESYSVNLGVASWEIDLFGRIRSLKDQALQEFLATEQAGRGARISIIAGTASAYFALAADRANLDLAECTLASQQDSYRLIKRQFDADLISEIDVRRAQTQVDAARLDVGRYTERVAQSRNALNLLAGGTVPEDLLPADLAAMQALRELRPGLSSGVLLKRPDIMAAEHQLIGANAFIGAARSAFFPRIGLTAAFGTASGELSGLFGNGTDVWNFTPVITMPIFDARVWAAARVSEATQKMALANYENTIQKAFREVADTLATRDTIGAQVDAQRSLVEAAEIIHRLAGKRYEQGLDSYLSVLDAHRTLFRAEQVLIALRLARRLNEVQTYAVLGGGALDP
jgi:multidrug efflux system outer membrane protein